VHVWCTSLQKNLNNDALVGVLIIYFLLQCSFNFREALTLTLVVALALTLAWTKWS
jgi:hypothetical protein